MDADLKELEKAESVQFYPYVKDDQTRLAITFLIPTEEEHPKYKELGLDEPLSWFIDEIWKPQIKRRIASLSRRHRGQLVQLVFYEKLAENLGIDIEELWNEQIEKAFLEELEKREGKRPEAAPIFSEEDFYSAVGFVYPEEVGMFLQDAINRIAKATIDLLAKKLEEKHKT
jgi:hypothetical protein